MCPSKKIKHAANIYGHKPNKNKHKDLKILLKHDGLKKQKKQKQNKNSLCLEEQQQVESHPNLMNSPAGVPSANAVSTQNIPRKQLLSIQSSQRLK